MSDVGYEAGVSLEDLVNLITSSIELHAVSGPVAESLSRRRASSCHR